MNTNETKTTGRVHPFERAGLGVAPFRYVGSYTSTFQAVPGDPNCPIQPGTSCDYCGTGISNACRVKDVNGKEFKVGCDCVAKTGDKRLMDPVKRDRNEAARKSAHIRADATIAAARAALPAASEKLKSQPHPSPYRAEKGETLLEHVEWMLKNAGKAGQVRAAKIILGAK